LRLPNPKALWILDEPFNALDQQANQALQSLLIQHVERGGIVAISSHQSLAIDDGPHVMRLSL
jgi:heme exporter protein A